MDLPELPGGYFWRLHSDSFGFMMVTIRRKRRFGSRSEECSMVLEDPPVPSAIRAAADRALDKLNKHMEELTFLAEFRTYEGDYTGG